MQQAMCFDAAGDVERSIANYSAVLEVDPRHDAAYNLRGCARLSRRGGFGLKLRHVDFSAVESDLQAAVRCNENNYVALCNLGRLYDEHGMFDKAVASYTRAMQVKDDYQYAAYRRGCAALTAVEAELRRAERAVDPDPTEVVLTESRAAVPFACEAPRDPRRVEPPKGVPQSTLTLPPITKARQAAAGGGAGRAVSASGAGAATAAGGASANNGAGGAAGGGAASAAAQLAAKQQVDKEVADEKHFAQLKAYLALAISDFSRLLAPLEAEDKVKELPTLLHRASCYLYEGDMEKGEEDIAFVRKSLDAYKDLQPPPATSVDAVKSALGLITIRLEQAKTRRRQGVPISPFASGVASLHASIKKLA